MRHTNGGTYACLTPEAAATYVLAGNSTFTLHSAKTGKHYTYRCRKAAQEHLYYLELLVGADNTKDYRYIGCYYDNTRAFVAALPWKTRVTITWPSAMRAIRFLFKKLYNIPANLHVYHEGRCGCCGRKLTTPESIACGLGPECRKRIGDN